MSELKQETIDKAVNWWVDKIMGNEPHDNGDETLDSLIACRMADMGRKAVTEEQIDIFKAELTKQIKDMHSKNAQLGFDEVWLGCDYGPDMNLSVAADAAGINHLNFPFKTDMTIKNNVVLVSEGYAQPFLIPKEKGE